MTWKPGQRVDCHFCGKSYGTKQSSGGHCRTCCESFGSQAAFDKHLGPPQEGGCVHPSTIKIKNGDSEMSMYQDEQGDWRIPPTDKQRENYAKFLEKVRGKK